MISVMGFVSVFQRFLSQVFIESRLNIKQVCMQSSLEFQLVESILIKKAQEVDINSTTTELSSMKVKLNLSPPKNLTLAT